MKKLLFTALAVVAFSGVSFAKTREVDVASHIVIRKNLIEIKNAWKSSFEVLNSCENKRVASYLGLMSRGFTESLSKDASWGIYWKCKSRNTM